MEVCLKDNHELNIELGNVFFDNNEEIYYIFTFLGGDNYGLIASTFDHLYNDEQFNNREDGIRNIKAYVKEQYLKYFSEEDYMTQLRIEKR